MRVRFVSAILAGAVANFVGVINMAAANASDLSNGQSAGGHGSAAYGARIEPVIIYDYQPGVIVRSYWDTPWANRHYFPSTGRKPKVGRLEHISARHSAHHRISKAEDYFRFWSASSVFLADVPVGSARGFAIPPTQPMEQPQ